MPTIPENADDPDDPILTDLSSHCLMIWIEGSDAHTDELVRRFDRAPKPMAYQPDFLARMWQAYLDETGLSESCVDPDTFIRWTYAKALAHRQPRYQAMARWGITITADEVKAVQSEDDFNDLIARALEKRTSEG